MGVRDSAFGFRFHRRQSTRSQEIRRTLNQKNPEHATSCSRELLFTPSFVPAHGYESRAPNSEPRIPNPESRIPVYRNLSGISATTYVITAIAAEARATSMGSILSIVSAGVWWIRK
jgi:hypothetical protein